MSRKKLESLFMKALSQKVFKSEHINLIYKKVAKEIQKQFSYIPEEIRLKKIDLNKMETRVHRFVEFIAEAKATASIATALEDAEKNVKKLKVEIGSLEMTKHDALEPPPVEWIDHRIQQVQNILESKTEKSALLLRQLFGKITLTPMMPDIGKPYYQAKSKFKSFALLEISLF